jgi:PAS domain S-box-containing protein
MGKTVQERRFSEISEENELLREEVQVARRASDITARLVVEQFVKIEKMLQRLEESENRYRTLYQQSSQKEQLYASLLNSTPDAVVITDLSNTTLYINPAFTQIFGFTTEDVMGMTIPFVPHCEEIKATAVIQQVLEGKPIANLDTKRLTKGGELREITLSASCYTGHEGEPAGIVIILRDVTVPRRAEEQIRKAKEEWERTFDAIRDVITIQDTQMRIVRMNRATAELLGQDERELIGRHCYELFQGRSSPCQGCPEVRTIEERAPYSAEIEHPGLGKIFLVTSSPILDEHGAFSGIVHSAKDVTEKRRMEEELLKSQKIESVGILAGGIAHDFNNILTAIMGNVSLSKMLVEETDKVFHRLDEAERACLRAKDLTYQLLTFSKGGAPIKKVVSLNELIRDSATFALMGSNVLCEFETAEDLWDAEVDEGQISQVVNNLMINACQAMPGGGMVRITTANTSIGEFSEVPVKPGPYVRLTVEDGGVGIAPEDIGKIFDPYFTTKEQGNGLGLTTAYSIVKRHGGHITLRSDLGVGTTFYIHLPAVGKEVATRKMQEDSIHGKGKVLVMDDEEIIRDVAGQMLSFLGYEAEFAKDGTEAVELYESTRKSGTPFDAVIMDLTIPGGMGGRDAIKELMNIDPQVKAIASSGYFTDPIMSDFREFGFKNVIAKPYKLKELGEVLNSVLASNPD